MDSAAGREVLKSKSPAAFATGPSDQILLPRSDERRSITRRLPSQCSMGELSFAPMSRFLDDDCRQAANVAQLLARPCAHLSIIRNSRAKSGLGAVFMKTQGEKSKLTTRLLFMGGRILLHRTGGDWRALVYLPG